MVHQGRLARAVLLGATAFAGVVGGHVMDYLLVVPDGTERHDLLARTGHGYLSGARYAGLFVALLAVCSALLIGWKRARPGPYRSGPRLLPTAVRLSLLQSFIFLLLEIFERISAGAGFGGASLLLGGGVLVQLIVGFAATLTLMLLDRLGRAVALAAGKHPRPMCDAAGFRVAPQTIVRSVPLRTSGIIRGPPRLLPS